MMKYSNNATDLQNSQYLHTVSVYFEGMLLEGYFGLVSCVYRPIDNEVI